MRIFIFTFAVMLAARPAAAQVMVGGGYGATYSGPTTGPAWHAQASAAFAHAPGPMRPRGEVYALAQHGTATGSGLSCGQVREFYCLGRSDRSTIAGAGIALVLEGSLAGGRVRPYSRVGGGIYHQRVKSTETEGPTGICFDGKELISCPDNPPFADYTIERSRTGPGIIAAFGVRLRALGIGGFVEVGSHAASLDGGFAGGAPFTIGLSL
ncbi:MAG TPA: hypothetical protein VF613_25915 [Longimicrobium sp.]|jgi:hypothetical protein